jgi:hypothetical protein
MQQILAGTEKISTASEQEALQQKKTRGFPWVFSVL